MRILAATLLFSFASHALALDTGLIQIRSTEILPVFGDACGPIALVAGSRGTNLFLRAWDIEMARDHRGPQEFHGRWYGHNAITPILANVVAASPAQEFAPLTGEQMQILSKHLIGRSHIDANVDNLTDMEALADNEAAQLLRQNSQGTKWRVGDPDKVLWMMRKSPQTIPLRFVGTLIAGYSLFGNTMTFYAGRITSVFAADGMYIFAEVDVPGQGIITVPLHYGSKNVPFVLWDTEPLKLGELR